MLSVAFSVSPCPLFLDSFRCSSQSLFLGAILLFVLYIMIKARIAGSRETPEAQDRDLGEGGKVQEAFDSENGDRRNSHLSDVSSLAFPFGGRVSFGLLDPPP